MRIVWGLLLVSAAVAAELEVPRIDLVYQRGGTVLDRGCADFGKGAVDPAQVDETARRLPEFQRWWDTQGPAYVKVALEEIGMPFPYRQMQATLTVCMPVAMSSPLLIATQAHLSGAAKPAPDWYFAFVVYHEIMHHYARAVYETSALRKKYASESPVTLNHLHVVALELFALKKLGKQAELDYLNGRYSRTTAGHRRAWEIVNAEGVQTVLEEIRKTAGRR